MSVSYSQILYESDQHKFIWLGADEEEAEGVIRTNQYLIIHNGKGLLIDPGGLHLFSRVVSSVSTYIDLEDIDSIFFSHQDPDVSSGIALWLGICKANIYISSLWVRFVPHFGLIDQKRIKGITDDKLTLDLNGAVMDLVPSHFMHSVGCYSLFDRASSILFSGDIGAADMAYDGASLFVEDFSHHEGFIVGFHKRYMSCRKVCAKWVSLVRPLGADIIAPQHGPLFRHDKRDSFLNWLEKLDCGTDLLDLYYPRS